MFSIVQQNLGIYLIILLSSLRHIPLPPYMSYTLLWKRQVQFQTMVKDNILMPISTRHQDDYLNLTEP